MAEGSSWYNTVLTVAFALLMSVSTGVATGWIAPQEAGDEVVAGHSTYIRHHETMSHKPDLTEAIVSYGLATHRESYLFDMMERTRPLDERDNRMVFAWRSGVPAPYTDPTLVPTGDQGAMVDRYGRSWLVHELAYGPDLDGDGRGDDIAYGVGVEAIHSVDRRQGLGPGMDSPQYNYAITYRLDRLFPEFVEGQEPGDGTGGADGLVEPPLGVSFVESGDVVLKRTNTGLVPIDGPARVRFHVEIAAGPMPASIMHEPAPADQEDDFFDRSVDRDAA